MKTLYIFLSVLIISNLSFSQSVEIISEDDNLDYSGQTVTVAGDDNMLSRSFHVKNTSGAIEDTIFYYSRTVINSTAQDIDIQLCDEVMCYTTTGPYWIGPEKSIQPGDSLLFKPQIAYNGPEGGSAEVVYYILDKNKNKIDSITVKFSSTLSTNKDEQITFNIYPNPAQEFVTIKGEGLKNGGTVVFLDALGKEVKRTYLKKNSNPSLSISDLKRGVYFVNIYSQDGLKSTTQRLIKQ